MSYGWLRGLTAALFCLICIAPNAVHGFQIPLMVGLGDSISAAALADTSTQKFWPLPWGMPIPSIDNPLEGIGFNSDYENKRTYSWVSGVMVNSHYKRLRGYLKPQGKSLWALNFAATGAVSGKVFEQVREARLLMKSGLFGSLPYITLMVGANDLCKSVPIEAFHKNVRELFHEIAKIKSSDGEPIRILVSSVPRIPQLGDPEILSYRTASGYSCRSVRNKPISYCAHMTQWKDQAERQALIGKVDEMNAVLRAETEDAGRLYPSLRTFFSSTLAEAPVDATRLAADCFHPNARGQDEIAQALWNDQPWFH